MTRPGFALAAYLAASHAIPLVAPTLLQRRLARGKEHPDRWREKLGQPTQPRPQGPLIWLHAVGLGETLALRGLIAAMAGQSDAHFLVTSTTRASAEVLSQNLPERTCHQFLPLDAPRYLSRFLDHWRPSLSIWAEQDLWPGAVAATDARSIPLALISARMNADAFARRSRFRGLYTNLFARFSLITAQDDATARHLTALGAKGVRTTGSLKAAAPPLTADTSALDVARVALQDREPLLVASSHPDDEIIALQAFPLAMAHPQKRLLLIAPRDPLRGAEIAQSARDLGYRVARRSQGEGPQGADVWVVDTYGEMGIWYRLCSRALVGGTFGSTEGHNPWEAAALGCAILHGPRTANFATDYEMLDAAVGALPVNVPALAQLFKTDLSVVSDKALALSKVAQGALAPLAAELLALAGLK